LKRYLSIALLPLALALCAGCGERDEAEAWEESVAATEASGGHTGHDLGAATQPATAAATGGPGGEVLETFDSGGYTYVRLQTADGELWAAGPVSEVAVGDEVSLVGAMVMKDFEASSLDRTFDEIWFATALQPRGTAAAEAFEAELKRAHGNLAADAGDLDLGTLAPPEGGVTVAALHADRAALAGRRVKLRGKVVKFLEGIMGRNWLHLQDGSGDATTGDHDVTVTTDGAARRGDTVVVEGTVAVDRDFGSGYFYTVIVEDATVAVEETL
jgi:hypothetical protein